MVANKFLEDVDMEDNVRLQCVSMCQHFHQVRFVLITILINYTLFPLSLECKNFV